MHLCSLDSTTNELKVHFCWRMCCKAADDKQEREWDKSVEALSQARCSWDFSSPNIGFSLVLALN